LLVARSQPLHERCAIYTVPFFGGALVWHRMCMTQGTGEIFDTFKVMSRNANAHALVNAGFSFLCNGSGIITSCRLVVGGITRGSVMAPMHIRSRGVASNPPTLPDSLSSGPPSLVTSALAVRMHSCSWCGLLMCWKVAGSLEFDSKVHL
jgi:hypothetical protein